MQKLYWAGALLLGAVQAFAAANTYDGFDHTLADSLGRLGDYPGKTAPTGQIWQNGGIWGTFSTLDAAIFDDNLVIAGLPISVGHSVQLKGVYESNGVADRIAIGGPYNETNATELYYSLILRVVALTDPGDATSIALNGAFMAGLNNGHPDATNGVTSAGTRLHVCLHNTDNTKFRIGLRPSSTAAPVVFDPTARTPGPDSAPLFIVGRYRFMAGGTTNDPQDLWIDPPSSTFGAASPPVYTVTLPGDPPTEINFPLTTSGADVGSDPLSPGGPPTVNSFFIRQNNVGPYLTVIDEVRVGLTWADVAPIGQTVLGPCCAADGSCSETSQWACTGTWENPGLTCADVTCPVPPLGPCCAANATCTETIELACAGAWGGPGLTCAEVTCSCDPVFDSDCDGDVDMADFGAFQACFTGSGGSLSSQCALFDRDNNGSVDLFDLGNPAMPIAGTFANCSAGSGVLVDPSCDDPLP